MKPEAELLMMILVFALFVGKPLIVTFILALWVLSLTKAQEPMRHFHLCLKLPPFLSAFRAEKKGVKLWGRWPKQSSLYPQKKRTEGWTHKEAFEP